VTDFSIDTFLESLLERAPSALRAQLTVWAKENGVLPGQEVHDEECVSSTQGVWRLRAWLLPCEPQAVFVLFTYLSGDVPEQLPLSWCRSAIVSGPVDAHIRQIESAFFASWKAVGDGS
jgi:hypothetical protein